MTRIIGYFAALLLVMPSLTTEPSDQIDGYLTEHVTESNPTIEYGHDIDTEYLASGVVGIFYNNHSSKPGKLIIESYGEKYTYDLHSGDDYVNYPLLKGSGLYTVSLYEHKEDDTYRSIESIECEVTMTDSNEVYLQSVMEVQWSEEDLCVNLADDLMTYEDIYDYVIQNLEYDHQKFSTLDSYYRPDSDKILLEGSGICFDYASLLASMLRSQGIPTKLVKGYAYNGTAYHAWNEVYLVEEDRWITVDPTADSDRYSRGLAYKVEKSPVLYKKTSEL